MSRVAIKQPVLQWILNRSGESVGSLRKRFAKISEWIDGSSEPTLRQVEALARATTTPLGWFFLDKPMSEEIPVPFFRTVADKPLRTASAELLETIYTVQRRQEWMREYLLGDAQPQLAFVESVGADTSPMQLAEKMRATLGFAENWALDSADFEDVLRRFRRAIEAAGIFVVVNSILGNNTSRALNPQEFRGFVLVDKYAPFVFVNGADIKPAQMFTLAHEFAHVFLGRSAAFDLGELLPAQDSVERVCNEAAAEFLMPAQLLRQYWATAKGNLKDLAGRFKVSQMAVARRALDLNLINKQVYSNFYRLAASAWRKKERGRGDFYASQPLRISERFGKAVVQALRDGAIQYTEAYSLTGLNRQTFDKFADGVE